MQSVKNFWLKKTAQVVVAASLSCSTAVNAESLGCTLDNIYTWTGGFTIDKVTVTNDTGSAVDSWDVQIQMDSSDVAISSYWDATVTLSDGIVTAESVSYNSDLDDGESTTFGFQGSFSGDWVTPTCLVSSDSSETTEETTETTEETTETTEETEETTETTDSSDTFCNDDTHSGEGTYYGGVAGSEGGNCSLWVDSGDYYHVAMNNTDYDGSNACGACVEITGPNGTATATVVDRCPECAEGDIDMAEDLFAEVADKVDGRVDITWEYVPCDESENIKVKYKSGSSIWWTGIQFRDIEHGIVKMEYQTDSGDWQEVDRELYNYFIEDSGISTPMTLRVTSVLGEELIFENVDLDTSNEYDTGLQFSTPAACQ